MPLRSVEEYSPNSDAPFSHRARYMRKMEVGNLNPHLNICKNLDCEGAEVVAYPTWSGVDGRRAEPAKVIK
jgi:hypothetical protein